MYDFWHSGRGLKQQNLNVNSGSHHICFHVPVLLFVLVGAVTVISPLELIRTKIQSRKFSYKELRQFVSVKVSEEGWLSLWKGWAPTVLRDVPFSGGFVSLVAASLRPLSWVVCEFY